MTNLNGQKRYEFLADDPNIKIMPIMNAFIVGTFFAMLNETLLNIALVTIMEDSILQSPLHSG